MHVDSVMRGTLSSENPAMMPGTLALACAAWRSLALSTVNQAMHKHTPIILLEVLCPVSAPLAAEQGCAAAGSLVATCHTVIGRTSGVHVVRHHRAYTSVLHGETAAPPLLHGWPVLQRRNQPNSDNGKICAVVSAAAPRDADAQSPLTLNGNRTGDILVLQAALWHSQKIKDIDCIKVTCEVSPIDPDPAAIVLCTRLHTPDRRLYIHWPDLCARTRKPARHVSAQAPSSHADILGLTGSTLAARWAPACSISGECPPHASAASGV